MSEKVALITGGSRGLGRALALALAQRGWRIAFCYRTSEREAEETLQEIVAYGATGRAERCDVSDADAASQWAASVEADWGRIDALLNCAGQYHRVALEQESVEGWHEMFDHNLHPVFYLARAVARGMRARQWGRVLNFSLANAEQMSGQPFVTAHYIAKAGVLILTRTLAKLLAPDGITVNCISPGFIDSGGTPWNELEKMVGKIPAGYIGKVEDVVALCCFLLSDEARYVNGANIQISGAWGV